LANSEYISVNKESSFGWIFLYLAKLHYYSHRLYDGVFVEKRRSKGIATVFKVIDSSFSKGVVI